MNNLWILFWCLPVKSQALLMEYQYNNYGYKIDIPQDKTVTSDGKLIHWGTEKL